MVADYELGRLVGAPSLTWDQFSQLFLEKYIPRSMRDMLRPQYEYLQKDCMTVTKYKSR